MNRDTKAVIGYFIGSALICLGLLAVGVAILA